MQQFICIETKTNHQNELQNKVLIILGKGKGSHECLSF
jgi:hypothetical protein